MGHHGADRLATGQRQNHLGVHRSLVNSAHLAPQVIARRGLHVGIGQQQDGGGFDHGEQLHAHRQPKRLGRFPGDYRHQLILCIQPQAHLEVHLAAAQADDLTGELVAGTALHRHAAQQLSKLLKIIVGLLMQAGGESIQRRLILGFQRPIEGYHLGAIRRQLGPTTLAPAGAAQHQGLFRQIVHVVDGIPGRLVGERHLLRRLGDGAMDGDRLQQADASIAEEGAKFGLYLQFGAQDLCRVRHGRYLFPVITKSRPPA